MKKRLFAVGLLVFLSVGLCGQVAAIAPPDGQYVYAYPSGTGPVKHTDPALCRPIAGQTAGGLLSLRVGLPAFSPAVDVYLALWAEALGADTVWMISQGDQVAPFPAGFLPWRADTSGNVDELLFGTQFPAAALPAGTYSLFAIVTPAGAADLSLYYAWTTYFVVPLPWQPVGGQVSPATAESEDPTMLAVNGAPAVGYRHESFRTYLNLWNGTGWGNSQPDPTNNQTLGSIFRTPVFCSDGTGVIMAYSHAYNPASAGADSYDRIFVYRWDPLSSWVPLNGGDEASVPFVAHPSADAYEPAVDCVPSGGPVVAWIETDIATGATDDAWIAEVSAASASRSGPLSRNSQSGAYLTDVVTLDVAAGAGGSRYLAQWEQHATEPDRTDLYVTRHDGGAFTPLGGAVADNYGASFLSTPSLAVAGATVYVAYSRANSTDHTRHIYVQKYDGSWTTLGGGPISAFPGGDHYDSANPDLQIVNGALYLAWEESSTFGGSFIYVARWDPALGQWLIVGDRLNVDPARAALDPSLAYAAAEGALYVAFEEMVDGWPQIFVKKAPLPLTVNIK